uniref:Uncharacterized protein n=1 Tax=Hemiselmis tepida TaxID=464990 RepID=A0A7S0VM98_9CRYP|mmetsp:Transcript_21462/g.54065  ORF Transcript_21462/g.54065 Transcript_21462/m.54065 type:complete len:412 (+) Transcript_21462:82-1317(+)
MAVEAVSEVAAKRGAVEAPSSPYEVQATVDSPPPAPLESTPEPADPSPDSKAAGAGRGDHDSVASASPAPSATNKLDGDAKVALDDKGNQVPFKVLLTQDQALEIYKVRPMDNSPNAKPTSMDVAEQYGVSPKTVRDVWNRKTWVKVTKPLWHAGELELFLSESVRRGPGGRQPSPHGEDGDENEEGRSRRPVREARLNKRVLEAPAEDATVARAAATPRKVNPKKPKVASPAIAPINAKKPKLSINTAPGSPMVLSGVSPGAMQRVRGGATPKTGKKNVQIFMPFAEMSYTGQLHASVTSDDVGALRAGPLGGVGGGMGYGFDGSQPSATPSTVPAGGGQHSVMWEPFHDSAELLSTGDDHSLHSLQEKEPFEFESSPCNVDYEASSFSCGPSTDTVSYMALDGDLAWCE